MGLDLGAENNILLTKYWDFYTLQISYFCLIVYQYNNLLICVIFFIADNRYLCLFHFILSLK